MTSRNRDVQVTMVRIQWLDRKDPITYRDNVTVALPKDVETNTAYIRISINQQMILSEELGRYQWIERSSTKGVVTIGSSTANIIMIYDAEDRKSTDLADELRTLLQKKPPRLPNNSSPSLRVRNPSPHSPRHDVSSSSRPSSQSKEDQIQLHTNELIQFIEEGSVIDAERAVRYLAQAQAKVQFNLIKHQDDVPSKAGASASADVLQLTIRIECHLKKEPLEATIFVGSGSKLYTLKDEIQSKTGIDQKDQYWYAFNRYMIADDYVFGSEERVVPPRLKNNSGKRMTRSDAPIRSGDTLIMYIARLPPFE